MWMAVAGAAVGVCMISIFFNTAGSTYGNNLALAGAGLAGWTFALALARNRMERIVGAGLALLSIAASIRYNPTLAAICMAMLFVLVLWLVVRNRPSTVPKTK